jgi:hypothetical protein
VDAVTLPEVPVMVTVKVPAVAGLLAVSVIMLEPVVGFGAKDAVTPLGRPDAARLTLPVNPYCGFTLTVDVPEVP